MAHLVLPKGHDPSLCDTGGLCVWTWCDEDAPQLDSLIGSHLPCPSQFALICAKRECSLGQLHLSLGVDGWMEIRSSVHSQAREMANGVA